MPFLVAIALLIASILAGLKHEPTFDEIAFGAAAGGALLLAETGSNSHNLRVGPDATPEAMPGVIVLGLGLVTLCVRRRKRS